MSDRNDPAADAHAADMADMQSREQTTWDMNVRAADANASTQEATAMVLVSQARWRMAVASILETLDHALKVAAFGALAFVGYVLTTWVIGWFR